MRYLMLLLLSGLSLLNYLKLFANCIREFIEVVLLFPFNVFENKSSLVIELVDWSYWISAF